MSMNRIQFQRGLSLPDFLARFGTEAQCEAALQKTRWPEGFRCPHCGQAHHSAFRVGQRPVFQCSACHQQTSLIAGTVFQSTHLPLTTWFLAIYLISEAKTGLSALALKRQLGVSYPTAWLIHHKLMQTMTERDATYTLHGTVQVDDAYLGGERRGGKAGRGSENKVPFVAAVAVDGDGHPTYAKMTPIAGFTHQALADWAGAALDPRCRVISDGLACFTGVVDAGCTPQPRVVGDRKPQDLPELLWVNTVLDNLKTGLGGAYHALNYAKYGLRYLGTFAYRFNRRFRLETLPLRLLTAAAATPPRPERLLRAAGVSF